MSNEEKRLERIDMQVGKISGQLDFVRQELNRLYHREMELEELAERYYTLLSVVNDAHWRQAMTPFWNSRRTALQKQAEELGISNQRKCEDEG